MPAVQECIWNHQRFLGARWGFSGIWSSSWLGPGRGRCNAPRLAGYSILNLDLGEVSCRSFSWRYVFMPDQTKSILNVRKPRLRQSGRSGLFSSFVRRQGYRRGRWEPPQGPDSLRYMKALSYLNLQDAWLGCICSDSEFDLRVFGLNCERPSSKWAFGSPSVGHHGLAAGKGLPNRRRSPRRRSGKCRQRLGLHVPFDIQSGWASCPAENFGSVISASSCQGIACWRRLGPPGWPGRVSRL